MRTHNDVTRWLAAGAGAALALAALTACSGSGGPGTIDGVAPSSLTEPTEPITITYAGAAYDAKQIQPVLDAFQAAHPNITVNYEAVPFDDFNSVLAARLTSSQDAIDVFDVDMPRTAAYAARGWLTDLTDTFPDLASAVDPGSLEAATVDGKVVTMPYQTSTNIMYYNKALLAAAGISAPGATPDDRETWEQITEDAKKAQDAGAQYGLLFDQIDRYYQLQPLAESAGGGPGGTGEGNLTPDVTNDGWEKAFSWYGSIFADGLSPRGVAVADTPNLFAAGKVAYYVGGPWWGTQFVGEAGLDFGIAPFPAFAGGEAATPTGGWSLGMNPQATADKANASAIFLKFMGIDDGGYAQYLSALAVPPSNLEGSAKFYDAEVFTDPRFTGVVDLMKSELATTATLRLQTVGYVEFEDIMTKTFDDIINGTDAKTALASATTQLDDAWAKYRQ
ncbi:MULTISPECIES: ABC transporter substrate-binding protein [Microbacterium]|jgi:multiple sugar transport system substrate-binding protein|uniref:Sugar ABC transporter substrate-binding protein n=1 Tax=Microbacterium mcarthurae TaxID=3035918 RepID=A0ABW9GHC4_9MICO